MSGVAGHRQKVRVDLVALKAACAKLRRATVAAERDQPDLHSLYKCQQFLREAVGELVWAAAGPTPNEVPAWVEQEGRS